MDSPTRHINPELKVIELLKSSIGFARIENHALHYLTHSYSLTLWVEMYFDFSMLLASFLLGAGYDAYVVYGYAPRWITLRDQAKTTCERREFPRPLPMGPELRNRYLLKGF